MTPLRAGDATSRQHGRGGLPGKGLLRNGQRQQLQPQPFAADLARCSCAFRTGSCTAAPSTVFPPLVAGGGWCKQVGAATLRS